MPTLHLLGTGAALSDASRTTTMLAFEGKSVVVVDCGGDVVQRLLVAGIELDRIAVLILTHEHPDHVAGFPLFMEKIWLGKRRRPLPVRGPKRALEQARRIFDAFDTSGWKGLPEIEWGEVPLREGAEVWKDVSWTITAAPGKHSVPVIGLRVESRESGKAAVYSSDTERTPAIEKLAAGASVLVHEATGGFKGHTSIEHAAEVARGAQVGSLVLVHLPPDPDPAALGRARKIFPETSLGSDGDRISF